MADKFGSRPSPARRLPDRVQVQDARSAIPVQPLRPQARPIDSFVALPTHQLPRSPLSQLAGALSAIEPKFQKFRREERVKEKTEAEAAAERELANSNFEVLHKAILDGTLNEFSSPFHQQAFFKVFGRELGERAGEQLLNDYNTDFDRDSGDIEQLLSDGAAKMMKGIDNPAIQSGGLAKFNRAADLIREKHSEFKTGQKLEIKYRGAISIFKEMYEDAQGDPEVLAAGIRDFYGQSKKLLLLGNAETDALVINFAGTLAELGDEAAVIAILKDTRGKIGSIAGKLGAQGKAAKKILKRAKQVRQTKEAIALQAVVAQNQVDADNGRLDREQAARVTAENPIAQPLGTLRSLYKADTKAKAKNARIELFMDHAAKGTWGLLRENATEKERSDVDNRMLSLIQAEGTKQDLSPQQILNEKVKFLVQNNANNSAWIDLFNTYGQANALNFAKGDKVPPQLDAAADLYNQIYASNPGLLERHIKNKRQREFYELVRVQENRMGVQRQDAMVNALTIQQQPDTPSAAMKRQRQFDALSSAIDDALEEGEGGIIFADNPVTNGAYVGQRLNDMARIYIRLGIDPEGALAIAVPRFLSTHTNINGFMVFTGGRRVDQADINEKAKDAILSYVEANPEQGLNPDDLTFGPIKPGTDGLWVVRDKHTGMVAPGAANTGIFSLNTLADRQVERKRNEINTSLDIRQQNKDSLEAIFDTSSTRIGRQGQRARAAAANRQAEGTEGPVVTVSPGQVDITPDSRSFGFRNNNPGNIRAVPGASVFKGQTGASDNGAFLKFDTPKAGIRALARILRTYRKRGLTDLTGILNTYSPPSENDTAQLIRNAVKQTGFNATTPIDVTDDAMMMRVVKAILTQEQSDIPYSDELIQSAINAAKRS